VEVPRELVVACCDAPPVLEAREGPFDDVAQTVGAAVERVLSLSGGVVGDDGRGALVDEAGSQSVAVVGGVGQAGGRRQVGEQLGRDGRVAPMAGTHDQAPWAPEFIDGGVDLGGAPAAGPADGLDFGPPFPPAAERCALT